MKATMNAILETNRAGSGLYREKNDEIGKVARLLRQHLSNADPRRALAITVDTIAFPLGATVASTMAQMGYLQSDFAYIVPLSILGYGCLLAMLAHAATLCFSNRPRSSTTPAFARLAQYDPIDRNAYLKLQDAITKQGAYDRDAIEDWIKAETRAIDELQHDRLSQERSYVRREVTNFLNRKI